MTNRGGTIADGPTTAQVVAGPHICTPIGVGGALPALIIEPLVVVHDVKLALVKCHTCKRWEGAPHVPECHFARCPMYAVRDRQPPQQRPENIPNLASGVHYGERT